MTGFEEHIARLPEASFISAPVIAPAQGAATAPSKPVTWHKARLSTYAMPIKDLRCNFRLRWNVSSSYCIVTISIRPTDLAQIIVKLAKVHQQFSCQDYTSVAPRL